LKMSDEPKPTTGGEWTAGHVYDLALPYDEILTDACQQIAEAHNAALATLAHAFESERDLRKRYEDENKTFRAAQKACEDCDGPTMAEVQQFRQQLAAEKDLSNKAMSLLADAELQLAADREREIDVICELQRQLSAEREKVALLGESRIAVDQAELLSLRAKVKEGK
jgi:hypothetical protein